jgi:UDP-N-acetyl-D-glucosamine dehydrogenase
VTYHDPHIPSFREDGHEMVGVACSDAVLDAADAVVVITDHTGVDYQRVADRAGLVVDSRNVMSRTRPGRARVVTLTSSR